jgi:hypothetical protein
MNSLDPMLRRLHQSRRLQRAVQGRLLKQKGEQESLLQLAELSGQMAWLAHPGTFALPEVERALMEVSGLEGFGVPKLDVSFAEGRTLHVLTEAYAVGGHTRLVQRWIDVMEEDRHAVVLVRQRSDLDPAWLIPAGRDVPLLDLEQVSGAGRCRKVTLLAELFKAARRVVLHIHPDDACTVAAVHRVPGADVRFLNHADHVAWLGAGMPAAVLNLRERGTHLAVHRRGIKETACDVIPLPITAPVSVGRREARASLGIGDQEVMLLTIASGYKYLPIEGRSLLDVLVRILERPEMRLVAVGPGPDHPLFSQLESRFPGRVHSMEPIPRPDLYRAAADIYLDSYPFCSPTSMLESAAIGTPVIAYQPDFEELGILYSDCPGLPRASYTAGNPEELQSLIELLATRRDRRQEASAALSAGMARHLPDGWRESVTRHLNRRLDIGRWPDRKVPTLGGHLDAMLAGLGRDPLDLPKFSPHWQDFRKERWIRFALWKEGLWARF